MRTTPLPLLAALAIGCSGGTKTDTDTTAIPPMVPPTTTPTDSGGSGLTPTPTDTATPTYTGGSAASGDTGTTLSLPGGTGLLGGLPVSGLSPPPAVTPITK